MRIYKTIISPVAPLREEYRLKVFENRMLRRMFGLREVGEDCIMRSFITCTLREI
jgi:hypothetical protein